MKLSFKHVELIVVDARDVLIPPPKKNGKQNLSWET